MRIFHSKHQKLIQQCYPAGKGVDKKPNPSELSYLLYYASTRRIKLEKVMVFLDRKTHSDAGRSRSGNLQVTLAIVTALIEKCSDNLNVFATYVCSILEHILKTGDLALCRNLVHTFGVFTAKLDEALFTGDKEFVHAFTSLSDGILSLTTAAANSAGPNLREWKLLSLISARHLFNCLGYNAKLSRHFIQTCVPLLVDTIHASNPHNNLLSRLRSNVNGEKDHLAISRVTSLVSQKQLNARIDEDLESGNVDVDDLNEEAFLGLRALFNTSLSSQIIEATKAVASLKVSSVADQQWNSTLLEMCVSWIPVQLRFVTLSTLLQKLISLSSASTQENTNFEIQTQYSEHILALVSSDVNMIGLSISDVIQQLLLLQANLYLHQADFLPTDQVRHLSLLYSKSICNLSSHIYYFDQVPDSIQEILFKIDSLLADSSAQDPDKLTRLIITFLDDIHSILTLLREKPSNITRNHATLDHWDISLALLNAQDYDVVSLDSHHIDLIQQKFLAVFRDFVNNELINGDDHASSQDLTTEKRHGNHLKPNFNEYITNPENILTNLFIYVDNALTKPSIDEKTLTLLLDTLRDLLSNFGVNFLANFIPYFFHWQESDSTTKSAFGYILLHHSLKVLDEKYPESVNGYAQKSQFFSDVTLDIVRKKHNDVWVKELSSEPSQVQNGILGKLDTTLQANHRSLQQFTSGNPFTSRWLNPQRPLLLEVIRHKAIERTVDNSGFQLDVTSDVSSGLEDITDNSVSTRLNTSNGLGLGTNYDITSIHSGLVNSHSIATRLNGATPNGTFNSGDIASSVNTSDKYQNMPRVADLKEIMSDRGSLRKPSANYDDLTHLTPGLVLSKQMAKSDLDSILVGLDSDDDSFVV